MATHIHAKAFVGSQGGTILYKTFGNLHIEEGTQYKHLGVICDKNMSIDVNIKEACTKLRSREFSGDGNVRILRQSCTSGYKYETFRICSLILSNKYFLVSHLKFVHFQGG